MLLRIVTLSLLSSLWLTVPQPSHAQYPGLSDPGTGSANSGDGFIPVDENVDGGALPVGATGQVVVRFRNETSQPFNRALSASIHPQPCRRAYR